MFISLILSSSTFPSLWLIVPFLCKLDIHIKAFKNCFSEIFFFPVQFLGTEVYYHLAIFSEAFLSKNLIWEH